MLESEQFHLTEVSDWKDVPAELAKIPAMANLRMIVWSIPRMTLTKVITAEGAD